jgi:hypothetical protein
VGFFLYLVFAKHLHFLDDAHGILASQSQTKRHLETMILFQEKIGIAVLAQIETRSNQVLLPDLTNLLFLSSNECFYNH